MLWFVAPSSLALHFVVLCVLPNLSRRPSLLDSREISLCESLLKLDHRNFHCWNHWMLVCKSLDIPIEEQLSFTWRCIYINVSNYSAWHFRGELLRKLLLTKSSSECLSMLQSGSVLLDLIYDRTCSKLRCDLYGVR